MAITTWIGAPAPIFDNMSDEELISIVKWNDVYSLSMERRFDGDDKQFNEFMLKYNLHTTIVDKLLIAGQAMRECLARGIQIPRGN